MKIVSETEKAVAIEQKMVGSKFSHTSEDFYDYNYTTLQWIPRSVCTIEGDEVVAVQHWFALKNMIYQFLTLVEENGKRYYR